MSDRKLSPEPSMDEILASIRRILAEDDQPVTHRASRPRSNGDVLDLTQAVNDDGSVRHIAPIALVTPEAVPPLLSDGRLEPVPPRPPELIAEPTPGPRLVSSATSEAIAASFARLNAIPRSDELDEVVREMLRPMLQAWLDAHLPELVERLVRAEIARAVGAIRPSAP